MNLDTFAYEYSSLSDERKQKGLEALFQWMRDHPDSAFVDEVLELASAHEADDGFGTEGLNV